MTSSLAIGAPYGLAQRLDIRLRTDRVAAMSNPLATTIGTRDHFAAIIALTFRAARTKPGPRQVSQSIRCLRRRSKIKSSAYRAGSQPDAWASRNGTSRRRPSSQSDNFLLINCEKFWPFRRAMAIAA
jgi:hypothetical protein